MYNKLMIAIAGVIAPLVVPLIATGYSALGWVQFAISFLTAFLVWLVANTNETLAAYSKSVVTGALVVLNFLVISLPDGLSAVDTTQWVNLGISALVAAGVLVKSNTGYEFVPVRNNDKRLI